MNYVNASWSSASDRHALNVFMVRVLFCLLAEDVGIFEPEVFKRAVTLSTQADGSDLAAFLAGAFDHMATDSASRPRQAKSWSKLPLGPARLRPRHAAPPHAGRSELPVLIEAPIR